MSAPSLGTADQDIVWMEYAMALASRAEALGEVPVGAVVVRDNEVLGEGWNCPISGNDPTAHAEIMALRDAAQRIGNYRLSGATLYVTIEPCTMCAGALVHARVDRLVFGATEPKAGAVGSTVNVLDNDRLNYRVAYQGGVCADACAQLISDFFRKRRSAIKAAKKAAKEAASKQDEQPS